jgi:hypothetical protein
VLTDPREIEIISKARQKNVRDPRRSREHFERIFEDFMSNVNFEGTVTFDLGPGQFDFGEVVRSRGGESEAIDNDAAVIELGAYKKIKTYEGNLKKLTPEMFDKKYDGLFCKLSINAFWNTDPEKVKSYIDTLFQLVTPEAWIWIAPWNGVPKKDPIPDSLVDELKNIQIQHFKQQGCRAFELTEKLAKHYGVHGVTANIPLFVRGLDIPPKVLECQEY